MRSPAPPVSPAVAPRPHASQRPLQHDPLPQASPGPVAPTWVTATRSARQRPSSRRSVGPAPDPSESIARVRLHSSQHTEHNASPAASMLAGKCADQQTDKTSANNPPSGAACNEGQGSCISTSGLHSAARRSLAACLPAACARLQRTRRRHHKCDPRPAPARPSDRRPKPRPPPPPDPLARGDPTSTGAIRACSDGAPAPPTPPSAVPRRDRAGADPPLHGSLLFRPAGQIKNESSVPDSRPAGGVRTPHSPIPAGRRMGRHIPSSSLASPPQQVQPPQCRRGGGRPSCCSRDQGERPRAERRHGAGYDYSAPLPGARPGSRSGPDPS